MQIVADTHVHFYACYDLGRFLAAAFRHLPAVAGPGPVHAALFLTERSDCAFYAGFAEGTHPLPGGFSVEPTQDAACLTVRDAEGHALTLVAGRQVATAERLEVLSLASTAPHADGRPLPEVIEGVLKAGGVPVLNWAPGKWFFRRGLLVREALESYAPEQLVFADSSLRPVGWPEPALLRLARLRGFAVLAGSDPLPFAGEEARVGTYGITGHAELDARRPLEGLRRWLYDAQGHATVGRRGSPLTVLRRLKGNRDAKRRA